MDGSQALHTSLIDAFECAHPQLEVGVDRVFHEHGNVNSPERVGQSLHCEGVGTGACAHPQYVDTVFQCQLHVLGSSHFG